MNRYTVKAVKTFPGHEGEPCAYGTLCCNGKKIADFRDDSWGGEMRIDWVAKERKKYTVPAGNRSKATCNETMTYSMTRDERDLHMHCKDMWDEQHEWYTDIFLFISDLVDKFMEEKNKKAWDRKVKRTCQKKICIRLKGDEVKSFRSIPARYTRQRAEQIRKNYGDNLIEIVNETLGIGIPPGHEPVKEPVEGFTEVAAAM